MLGQFEREDFGQPGDAVLGGDISRLERACRERMGAGGGDDPAPAARFHMRHGKTRRVERRRKVERDDRVPFLGREFLDRSNVLHPGVVDEDVDGPGLGHQVIDARGGGEVGACVNRLELFA